MTAIESALDNAPKDALVVIFPEQVSRAIELIMARNPVADLAQDTSTDLSFDASPLEPMPVGGQ